MLGWLFGRKRAASEGGATEQRDLISLSRKLDVPPAKAFEAFVDRFGRWWPRERTWAGDRLTGIVIEPRYGGSVYETDQGGERTTFGTVLAFDRPKHIVLAWQIRPDRSPEPNEAAASRLDVRFVGDTEGKTDLLIVHRDFPRYGEGWEAYKAEMAKAWPALIDAYVRALAGT